MVAAVAPAPGQVIPFSCSTHLANDVTDHLRQAKLTARAWEVCAYLHRQTFGNAGWHRKRGQPETRCAFDLATWAAVIPCDRSNLRRTLAELEACHILWLDLDPERPGSGHIGWNLHFPAWRPYDQRRQRGRPQQGNMVKSAATEEQEAGMVTSSTPLSDHASLLGGQRNLSMSACSEEPLQTVGANKTAVPAQQASVVRLSVDERVTAAPTPQCDHARLPERERKVTTLAWSQTASQAAPGEQRRKGVRKKITETPDVVSEGTSPSPETLSGSGDGPVAPSGAPPAGDQPVFSSGVDKGAMEWVAPPSVPPNREPFWPPRQAWERTDLDYYQRVLREREKERVALLTRLAHERIGVLLETASYARIGALAKQCGAALLVKHILLATANHIDGDPLDYLTKLARGQQRKEAAHATRSPTPTSAYQPYSAEEARTLVWNTL